MKNQLTSSDQNNSIESRNKVKKSASSYAV